MDNGQWASDIGQRGEEDGLSSVTTTPYVVPPMWSWGYFRLGAPRGKNGGMVESTVITTVVDIRKFV